MPNRKRKVIYCLWHTAYSVHALSFVRPGTFIAPVIGGVLLLIILVMLMVFYLRRQRHLKRKETMRRILQENEVRKGLSGGVGHEGPVLCTHCQVTYYPGSIWAVG